jgi:hypothetical protein
MHRAAPPCDHRRVTSLRPLSIAILLSATALLASCGDDESPAPQEHKELGVIRGWVETLADGDVDGAADYFAVPSVVQNATPPMTLRSRADVVAFNRSLPCGAKLVKARPVRGIIVATFRLRERPGGDCGSGVGLLARTAFVIKNERIVQWRRLPNPPQQPPDNGPIV